MDKLSRRKDIRLKDYDYSKAGYYFVTICTQGRKMLFGDITNGILTLNNRGEMIERWFNELESKFTNVSIDKYIVMPNHVHCVIIVGADLRVCPNGGHIGPPLPKIIQWLKTMTTNEYVRGVKTNIYPSFDRRIWQRNYYEHVIRNEGEYQEIWQYIDTNPLKWQDDEYYTL